jgi:hypothetical protein
VVTDMTTPAQEDLFGNPVDTAPGGPADTAAAATPPSVVNDMDLVQSVLADITSDTTAPLHVDDDGQVRRCARASLVPVPEDMAVTVNQLLTAQYLTATRTRSCPGHGLLVITTRTGRNAVHRWRAYRRPTTWLPRLAH